MNFKKGVVAGLCILALNTAHSCPMQDSTTQNVRDVINKHGGYPISDSQCNLLNRNGLALNVSGAGVVLRGVNVAWVVVSLVDQKTNITSDKMAHNTQVNTGIASQTVADDLLYDAVSAAVKSLDWNTAAKEVLQYRTLASKK